MQLLIFLLCIVVVIILIVNAILHVRVYIVYSSGIMPFIIIGILLMTILILFLKGKM